MTRMFSVGSSNPACHARFIANAAAHFDATSLMKASARTVARRDLLLAGAALFLGSTLSRGANNSAPMTYIYNAPESPSDVRYEYHWEILRSALERTTGKFGPYRMRKSKVMTEARQAYELLHATGELTVMYLDPKPDFERQLVAIHIPVDKNLVGYRIFLIRRERASEFRAVATLDDLRKFSVGLGANWIDVDILRNNGFKVVTGSAYDGLFEMLVNGRFDALSRGANEILGEVEQRKAAMPDLCVEGSICCFYPAPMYFWFPMTGEGRRLAARAEEGMRAMIADGSYDRIFDQYQQHKIEQLHLKDRKIIRIENPFLGPETPMGDKRLWFDPLTYQPTR